MVLAEPQHRCVGPLVLGCLGLALFFSLPFLGHPTVRGLRPRPLQRPRRSRSLPGAPRGRRSAKRTWTRGPPSGSRNRVGRFRGFEDGREGGVEGAGTQGNRSWGSAQNDMVFDVGNVAVL